MNITKVACQKLLVIGLHLKAVTILHTLCRLSQELGGAAKNR